MFGCIRKLGCLVILAVAIAVGYYFWARVPDDEPAAPGAARTIVWERLSPALGAQGRSAVERLAGGQGYASLSAGQVASYIFLEMANSLPDKVQDLEAAVIGDRLAVRGLVSLADIGGSKMLGPLAQMLSDRDTLLLSGTMNVLATGEGQFVVKDLRFGDFRAPSGLIPRIVRQIDKTEDRGPLAPAAIFLPLPPGVGDIRVGGAMVTLYKTPR
ncbi:MAG TPA: hypothetical protein VMY38_09255 [Gemmatimonadaceae bacterium]|nr:hypothetical protein [Gemmatimonadaceae bacterium]